MNKLLLTSALFVTATTVLAQTTYNNETIDATADIYRAGTADLSGDGGSNPDVFTLPSSPIALTFSSVTGTITLNGGGGYNNPDGLVVSGGENGNESSDNATGGLSGITEAGQGALLGVFITATSPSTVPTPASLDFQTIGTTFASLSPLLDQVFFIGDGLTGNGSGSVQQFNVPAGATELVLGIGDAPGYNGSPGSYGDNSGSFNASFAVTSANSVPDSSAWFAEIIAVTAIVGTSIRARKIRA